MVDNMYVGHTLWPPGIPLLLMPAVAVSGEKINWLAVKVTMAIVGLIGVLAVWCLVRRVTQSTLLADLATLFVALNPFYWDFSHQAMAEVPTITWTFIALLLGDLMYARRRPRYRESFAVGFVSGLGMLIKGNLLGLALIPLAYWIGPRSMTLGRRGKMVATTVFVIGFALPYSIWTVRNWTVEAMGFDGVNQVRMIFQRGVTDPELKSFSETVQQSVVNLRWYGIYRLPEQIIPGLWVDWAFAWPGSGWLAAGLCFLILLAWIPWRWQEHYLGLDLVLGPMIGLYLPYAEGGTPRYWVSAAVLLGVLLVIRLGTRNGLGVLTERRRWLLGFAMLLLGLNIASYVVKHEREPYNTAAPWKELAQLFDAVAAQPIDTAGVLTPNMHAFQLMTGCPAPMATAQYNPTYDHMIARLDGKWPQPPQGAVDRLSVPPWALYKLSEPKTRVQLLGEGDFSVGIKISE
jgi:hypothetical protein